MLRDSARLFLVVGGEAAQVAAVLLARIAADVAVRVGRRARHAQAFAGRIDRVLPVLRVLVEDAPFLGEIVPALGTRPVVAEVLSVQVVESGVAAQLDRSAGRPAILRRRLRIRHPALRTRDLVRRSISVLLLLRGWLSAAVTGTE